MEGIQSEAEGAFPAIEEKSSDEKLINEQQHNTINPENTQSNVMTLQVVVTHPLLCNRDVDDFEITSSAPTSPSSSFLLVKSNSGISPSSRRPSKSEDSFAFRSRRNTKNDSTKDNRGIYSWGRGGEGQLGHGDYRDEQQPLIIEKLRGEEIVSISCNGKHNLAVSDKGYVWSWGWNSVGQLGHGDAKDVLEPTQVKALALARAFQKKKFIMVAAGSEHSCALTNNGQLYSWGCDSDGQLGNDEGSCLLPQLVLPLHKYNIIQVSCGGGHTMALTDSGVVLSWGKGANGRLGHGHERNLKTPRKIKFFVQTQQRILNINCGWSHSMAINDKGQLFSWGKGSDGFLGHGDMNDVMIPKLVELLNGVIVTQCTGGYYHSAVLTDTGSVFTFGWNEHGQLGLGKMEESSVSLPMAVTALRGKPVRNLNCGGFHTAFVHTNGQVSFCGSLFESETVYVPTLVESMDGLHVSQVCSGWWHLLLIEESDLPPPIHASGSFFQTRSHAVTVPPDVSFMDLPDIEEFVHSDSNNNNKKGSRSATAVQNLKDSTDDDWLDTVQPLPPTPTTKVFGKLAQWWDNMLSSFSSRPEDGEERQFTEKEWQELMEKHVTPDIRFNNYGIRHSRLKALWRQGIPWNVRGLVWKKVIGNQLNISESLYQTLIKVIIEKKRLSTSAESQTSRMIRMSSLISDFLTVQEVDIPRTWHGLEYLSSDSNVSLFDQQLAVVLEAYALFCPNVGYVQGMTYIAGMLSLCQNSYDAFVSFANLLNSHFFSCLFKMDISEILKHIKIFDHLFAENIPEVYRHFKDLDISPEHYLVGLEANISHLHLKLDWLMTLFSKSFPIPLAFRIWDCFLFEGEAFLYRSCLGIIKCFQSQIKGCSFEECIRLLKNLNFEGMPEDKVMMSIVSISIPEHVYAYVLKLEKDWRHNLSNSSVAVPQSSLGIPTAVSKEKK